jgi:hypothetical protein
MRESTTYQHILFERLPTVRNSDELLANHWR